MANTGLQLTGQATPSGRIPFIRYDPPNETKPQPLIIFLHGQGECSTVHNSTSVLTLQESGHGIFTLTKSADLPTFTDPVTGEQFQYYMLGPQLYGVSTGGVLWPRPTSALGNVYVKQLIAYALNPVNGMNVDPKRIYLSGLSLGAGGTLEALMDNEINKYISAAAITCPGYANDTTLYSPTGMANNLAKSGVPIKWLHAYPDSATNPPDGITGTLISRQIVPKLNALSGVIRPYDYVELVGSEYAQGGHQIWYVLYDTTTANVTKNTTSGTVTWTENTFEWLLRFSKHDLTYPVYT